MRTLKYPCIMFWNTDDYWKILPRKLLINSKLINLLKKVKKIKLHCD